MKQMEREGFALPPFHDEIADGIAFSDQAVTPRLRRAALAESAIVTIAAPSMIASLTTRRPRPLR